MHSSLFMVSLLSAPSLKTHCFIKTDKTLGPYEVGDHYVLLVLLVLIVLIFLKNI